MRLNGAEGTGPTIRVTCPSCGFLGSFWVTPEQPLAGARMRAAQLRDGHPCISDPLIEEITP